MRLHPPTRGPLALGLLVLLVAAASERSYRADALNAVPAGPPGQVRALLPAGSAWPAAARQALERQIQAEWPADRLYGPLQTGPGVWLERPLVTARVSGRTQVPVYLDGRAPVRGRLELPPPAGPKRVVILIDASESANARTLFENADGSVEQISVLEAERRALDHLLDQLDGDWLELGMIAFGEGTWPIAKPGASPEELRSRLQQFRSEHPLGEGRTDTVCALWTAWDWLEHVPDGVAREIVLLTDGDLPHSGRFTDCRRARGRAREVCEARRNHTTCPASRVLRARDGRSDLRQLDKLAGRLRRKLRISPVVFESDRRAQAYRTLAERTGGTFVQVPSVQAADVALPPLVAGRIHGVYARNERTGERTEDLLARDGLRFAGTLRLAPGANDLELWVESDRGPAARFRFRVYAGRAWLDRYLADLRERNERLARRAQGLVQETRALAGSTPSRSLSVTADER